MNKIVLAAFAVLLAIAFHFWALLRLEQLRAVSCDTALARVATISDSVHVMRTDRCLFANRLPGLP